MYNILYSALNMIYIPILNKPLHTFLISYIFAT